MPRSKTIRVTSKQDPFTVAPAILTMADIWAKDTEQCKAILQEAATHGDYAKVFRAADGTVICGWDTDARLNKSLKKSLALLGQFETILRLSGKNNHKERQLGKYHFARNYFQYYRA